ncbi:aldose 1-epimerase [Gelidibacter salicanalis]|uniref:Aldose 1-epimerase n=1 Tax=Gelidibacter salicanalis TaxID=291193 RepID=A0A5C7AHV9_9FLAO|nr:aldose 1-epimerase [Gelidibacter salicanalis]TXE08158.1 aldose 1-epimerase [Gelidibacter salicanalis]
MYTLTTSEAQGLQFIELSNADQSTKATLCLTQGGRLSDLQFNTIKVLANYAPSTYKDNYASSILFPFANRVKDGAYAFEGQNHDLECNEVEKNNALHGLVYDKHFVLSDSNLQADQAVVTITYNHDGLSKGFPFKFDMALTYKLTDNNLSLSITVINTDTKAFPFTLGWHPYFISKDLEQSSLVFESDTRFLCDTQQIISGSCSFDISMPYNLKGVILDDGYELQKPKVEFHTPEYILNIDSTSKENYLQLYTPKTPNVIAIEPMTGAADSFNNTIGLQILKSKASYDVTWSIAFTDQKQPIHTNTLIR